MTTKTMTIAKHTATPKYDENENEDVEEKEEDAIYYDNIAL